MLACIISLQIQTCARCFFFQWKVMGCYKIFRASKAIWIWHAKYERSFNCFQWLFCTQNLNHISLCTKIHLFCLWSMCRTIECALHYVLIFYTWKLLGSKNINDTINTKNSLIYFRRRHFYLAFGSPKNG